jgi:fucose 4-O-acetylase-like acetyltransferase
MKDKWKNLSIALIIAVIVTGILAIVFYYSISKPSDENTLILAATPQARSLAGFLTAVSIIGLLAVVFCITTLVSYMIMESLRKKKK